MTFKELLDDKKPEVYNSVKPTYIQSERRARRSGTKQVYIPETGQFRTEAVYVSGPMSGMPEHNFPAFNSAAATLRQEGYLVYNPAENDAGSHHREWDWYMALDFTNVCRADKIMLLPGWERSPGANAEVLMATLLKRPVVHFHTRQPLVMKESFTSEVMRVLLMELVQSMQPTSTPSPFVEAAPETILEEANRIVNGPRRDAYGHPINDYTRTAKIWSAILGTEVTAEQAILCMIGVKLSRETNKPGRDNRVDMCGYAQCLDMVFEKRQEEAKAYEEYYKANKETK